MKTMAPSIAVQRQKGLQLRSHVRRSTQGEWNLPVKRRDARDLLQESNEGRLDDLIPLRWERMRPSPFTFFRGSAILMAHDLATTPVTGIHVQSCGDCHLQNFGWFATPERNLAFDITDFDETLSAPWEWDLKRLATSCVLAVPDRRFGWQLAESMARSYRLRMAELSYLSALELWYTRLDVPYLVQQSRNTRQRRGLRSAAAAAHSQTIEKWLPKLTAGTGQNRHFRKRSKEIVHREEAEFQIDAVQSLLERYSDTLQSDRRDLLRRFQLRDVGFKVVGVGSVGLRCLVGLMLDAHDQPLVLQIKEARPSVLAPFVPMISSAEDGQRVVAGQRLMQSAGDPFLGWGRGTDGRSYYVRQLRDLKLSLDMDRLTHKQLLDYTELCGWALARAHARSGHSGEIAGYLGDSAKCDQSVAEFAVRYAAQVIDDFEACSTLLASQTRSGSGKSND